MALERDPQDPTNPLRVAPVRSRLPQVVRHANLIGGSPKMLALFHRVDLFAKHRISLCVIGETGTGKREVAEDIHARSGRTGRFVLVNCANFVGEQVESELFGHVRGAFTGAVADRDGRLVEADTGTLFLDELDLMPLATQSRLLTFLDKGERVPMGGSQVRMLDVRVVCTLKREPFELVAQGRLLPDLAFRIDRGTLVLPPLREREGDLDPLIDHIVASGSCGLRKPVSEAARQKLAAYPWPGNVRELISTLESAVILSEDSPEVLPEHVELHALAIPTPVTEREVVARNRLQAVIDAGGNKKLAATRLGISQNTLRDIAVPPGIKETHAHRR